jgi:hypothetical protein
MPRSRHPNKHIERAIRYAEALGWEVDISPGHAWGHLYCPFANRAGCRLSIWSTPRNPENHARQLRRDVDRCPHRSDADDAHET